ncbi:MAG: spore coat protein CotJB [Bacillota bacterium]|jgi:hypothetical protein
MSIAVRPKKTTQRQLLEKICKLDFIITEIALYLDNHSDDLGALARLEEVADERAVLYEEYVNTYGPIRTSDAKVDQGWLWAEQNFPWDM